MLLQMIFLKGTILHFPLKLWSVTTYCWIAEDKLLETEQKECEEELTEDFVQEVLGDCEWQALALDRSQSVGNKLSHLARHVSSS